MRISDWSSYVCSSDLGQRRRTGPAATFPMKSYPLRVGERGRLALAPERPHLGPFVQMGVSDDRARGLDELPMPEHIDKQIGSATVRTTVTNAELACRLIIQNNTHNNLIKLSSNK